MTPGIGRAEAFSGFGVNADGFDLSDPVLLCGDLVAVAFKICGNRDWKIRFEDDRIGKPLLVEARRVDRSLRAHAEAHPVED